MHVPTILFTLSAIALCGCVEFKARSLTAGAASESFAGRTLQDAGLKTFLAEQGAASGSWSVDRLALVATFYHPDVALARAEEEEAAAAVKTAKMRPDPVFTFAPQFASNHVNGLSPWFIGPSLAVPIETAGKRSRRTEQALAVVEAARWRVSSRAWAARSRVRSAMLDLHSARENLALLEAEQALHDEAIKKLTAQMEAGDVSAFELTQARLMLNRTRLAMHDAQRNAATSEAKLAAACGLPSNALQGVKLDFEHFKSLPSPSISAARKRALTQRADLLALLAEYAAAEAALKLEVAKQYPDLNVRPGYDYNQGQNRWQLGLSVTLPISKNAGPIAQAEAKRLTAEKRFLAVQSSVQGEIDITLAAYNASRAKADTAAALAGEAATASDTTQRMVEGGQLSALELTRRKIEASAARVALLTAKIQAQVDAGALEDAMQATLR